MGVKAAAMTVGGVGVDKGRPALGVKRKIAVIVIASPARDFIDGHEPGNRPVGAVGAARLAGGILIVVGVGADIGGIQHHAGMTG